MSDGQKAGPQYKGEQKKDETEKMGEEKPRKRRRLR